MATRSRAGSDLPALCPRALKFTPKAVSPCSWAPHYPYLSHHHVLSPCLFKLLSAQNWSDWLGRLQGLFLDKVPPCVWSPVCFLFSPTWEWSQHCAGVSVSTLSLCFILEKRGEQYQPGRAGEPRCCALWLLNCIRCSVKVYCHGGRCPENGSSANSGVRIGGNLGDFKSNSKPLKEFLPRGFQQVVTQPLLGYLHPREDCHSRILYSTQWSVLRCISLPGACLHVVF